MYLFKIHTKLTQTISDLTATARLHAGNMNKNVLEIPGIQDGVALKTGREVFAVSIIRSSLSLFEARHVYR